MTTDSPWPVVCATSATIILYRLLASWVPMLRANVDSARSLPFRPFASFSTYQQPPPSNSTLCPFSYHPAASRDSSATPEQTSFCVPRTRRSSKSDDFICKRVPTSSTTCSRSWLGALRRGSSAFCFLPFFFGLSLLFCFLCLVLLLPICSFLILITHLTSNLSTILRPFRSIAWVAASSSVSLASSDTIPSVILDAMRDMCPAHSSTHDKKCLQEISSRSSKSEELAGQARLGLSLSGLLIPVG